MHVQNKNKKELLNEHKNSPLLSPVGQFKFDIDQQTFSRFNIYYRFS